MTTKTAAEALEELRTHELKCWPDVFGAMIDGSKPFEYRKDDREPPYKVGDSLRIREWKPDLGWALVELGSITGEYTGREVTRSVTHILRGAYGVPDGYCVLGLRAHPPATEEGRAPTYTYASDQATNCAVCGVHKHTPLRVDSMGGYVCLTCIDRQLEKHFAQQPAQGEEREREAFETYMLSGPLKGCSAQRIASILARSNDGDYHMEDAAYCWGSWQARAALTPQIGEAVGTIRAIDEERWEFGVQWHRTDMKRGDCLYLHPTQPAEQSGPDLSDLSPEAIKRRTARMEQAFPILDAFYRKHALGSMLCPSCLKCGQMTQPEDRAIQHAELPDIFICNACHKPAEQEGDKARVHNFERCPSCDGDHDDRANCTHCGGTGRISINATPKG